MSRNRESRELNATNPRLIVVSAPSGAGKTTLCHMLLDKYSNIQPSVSTTTRPRRSNEVEGRDYFFVSEETFDQKIKNNDFAEWAEVHGNRYGTERKAIENALAKNNHILFDIDYQGAINLQKLYTNKTLLFFIHPPSMEELSKRLNERKTDSEAIIARRLQNAYNEVAWSKSFDYEIVNDNLEQAFQDLSTILEKECL